MCGICGFTNKKNTELLYKMTSALTHRGPDSGGYYTDENISLGVRRLKVIDILTGDQPIYNEDRTVVVVFNGEIYNHIQLRQQLESKNHKFYTRTDTEIIVHLYEEYGEDFLKYLCGMFAIALWDSKKSLLFLARDRLGIKPLFYANPSSGNIVFASEIRAILLEQEISQELNLTAIDNYFTFLYIPQPETIYKNIFHLPPAHYLVCKDNKVELKKYWNLKFNSERTEKENFYIERLEELLKETIKQHLISDVPLAVFLSGGLDSSTVTTFASKIATINSFTLGYSERDVSYNEFGKARIISERLKTNHKEFVASPDSTQLLSEIISGFSQPFADSSAIPTYLVSKAARENYTVALTGIGGDKLFCGYPRYLGMKIASVLPTLNIPRNIIELIPESYTADNSLGRFKRFLSGLKFSTPNRYLSFVSYIAKDDKLNFYTNEFRAFLARQKSVQPHEHYFNLSSSGELLNQIMFVDINTYLCDDLLCMADRMSMLNSLELRVPFCDHRVVEFAASIPPSLKMKGLTLKYLIRKTLSKHLPSEIIEQKKMDFMVPLARWLRDELKSYMEEFIRKKEYGDYLRYEFIEKMWAEHIAGKRNFSDQLWSLLVFDKWRELCQIELPLIKEKCRGIKKPKIHAKKILVMNLGGLGDISMMSPIIKLLRDHYPNAYIELLTIPRSLELAKNFSEIDEFSILPLQYRHISAGSIPQLLKTIKMLNNKKFDVLINLRAIGTFGGLLKMFLLCKLLNAKITIGRNISNFGSFYDIPIKEERYEKNSEVELTAKLISALGIETKPEVLHITWTVADKDRNNINEYLSKSQIENHDLIIGLNPWAFRPSRRWPVKHWRKLIELMNEKYQAKIFITGEKCELPSAKEIADGFRNVIVTNGILSFNELSALFERMELLITNDTGPMHLAAAVGTKVVGIFGPGDVNRFTPYVSQERCRIVRKADVKCIRPCYKFKCKNPVCLTEVYPEDVLKAVSEIV